MSSSEDSVRPPRDDRAPTTSTAGSTSYAADLHRSAKELVDEGRGRARLRRGAGADHHGRGAALLRQVRARGSPGAGHRAGGRGDADRDRDAGGGLRDAARCAARADGARALVPAPARRERCRTRAIRNHSGQCCEEQAMNQPVVGRAADAAGPGDRHLDRQPRDPPARQDRRPPAQAAGLVRRRRRRAPRRDGVVERGRAVHRRSGRSAIRRCTSTRTASARRPTASTAISACATRASAAASRIRTACARRSRTSAFTAT